MEPVPMPLDIVPHTIYMCIPYASHIHVGFPGGSVVKNLPGNAGDLRDPCFEPWVEEDPLEDSMATYSSSLAWRIPWTEEPGGLESIESQTV